MLGAETDILHETQTQPFIPFTPELRILNFFFLSSFESTHSVDIPLQNTNWGIKKSLSTI